MKAWSIDVPVTADVAFAYLADVTRHAEWSPKPYWIDPPPELPLVVGSRFTSHGRIPGDRDHVNEVEVVALDPPHTLVLESAEMGDRFVHRFDVVATATGCEITRTVDGPKPTGFLGFVFPGVVRPRDRARSLQGHGNAAFEPQPTVVGERRIPIRVAWRPAMAAPRRSCGISLG